MSWPTQLNPAMVETGGPEWPSLATVLAVRQCASVWRVLVHRAGYVHATLCVCMRVHVWGGGHEGLTRLFCLNKNRRPGAYRAQCRASLSSRRRPCPPPSQVLVVSHITRACVCSHAVAVTVPRSRCHPLTPCAFAVVSRVSRPPSDPQPPAAPLLCVPVCCRRSRGGHHRAAQSADHSHTIREFAGCAVASCHRCRPRSRCIP